MVVGVLMLSFGGLFFTTCTMCMQNRREVELELRRREIIENERRIEEQERRQAVDDELERRAIERALRAYPTTCVTLDLFSDS